MRIKHPDQKGVFHRYSCDLEDTKMVQGTYKRITNDFDAL